MSEITWVGSVFWGLMGLAFGSFLNVCVARLPEGESVVQPRSHCRACTHTLAWWENLPLLSWMLLRGRCRKCRGWIGVRYPLVELGVGLLWVGCWLRFGVGVSGWVAGQNDVAPGFPHGLVLVVGYAVLCWLLLALAMLDAELFWLPDVLTWPGIGLGLVFAAVAGRGASGAGFAGPGFAGLGLAGSWWVALLAEMGQALVAGGVVLLIRLAYWLVRRREGMGLGDAKLMAMLGAWLGLLGALESFALAALAATGAALVWLVVLAVRRKSNGWAEMPLQFGTFLCGAAMVEMFFPGWLWNGLGYAALFR